MTYYRTTITLEVLSDVPLNVCFGTLGDIAYECTEGDFVGSFKSVDTEECDKERISELLIEAGSEPEFLLGWDNA